MAGATRGILFLSLALVLAAAILAGISAGQYMLTLALGATTATVIGIGFMTQARGAEPTRGSVTGMQQHVGGTRDAVEAQASLPDPMAEDFEMPL